MKVISIKQPWASLIVYGYKKYEFRSWKTKYRGELYIHASLTEDKNVNHFLDLNIPFEKGKIIGKVNLEDCIKLDKNIEKEIIKENPKIYGHTSGREGYAWKVSDAKTIDPIKAKGKLSIWTYDEH